MSSVDILHGLIYFHSRIILFQSTVIVLTTAVVLQSKRFLHRSNGVERCYSSGQNVGPFVRNFVCHKMFDDAPPTKDWI